jgi:acyl carrier protein
MMENKIFKVISDVLDVPLENVNKSSSPDDFESWDSLKQMNLIIALEESFEIQFSDEQIITMLNVELIIIAVKELIDN